MKKILYIGILAGVLLVTGCKEQASVEVSKPVVYAEKVQLAISKDNIFAGEVRGRYETQLSFETNGRIIGRYVEAGERVQKGQLLMQIDTKNVDQLVIDQQAKILEIEADVKFASDNYNRFKQLYEQNAISLLELERYKTAMEMSKARMEQAQAGYQARLTQHGYTSLVADKDGIITAINAEKGQVVGAGQQVMILVGEDEKEIEIFIPENKINSFKADQEVNVEFWALKDVTLKGKIREIAPMADKLTRTYKARITIIDTPAAVKFGMTAGVNMLNETSKAIFIPISAVYEAKKNPSVWVVNEGKVNLKPIKLGKVGDERVEVIEGLKIDEIVITRGVHKIREGQEVKIFNGDKL